jgi:hypothetical protein
MLSCSKSALLIWVPCPCFLRLPGFGTSGRLDANWVISLLLSFASEECLQAGTVSGILTSWQNLITNLILTEMKMKISKKI